MKRKINLVSFCLQNIKDRKFKKKILNDKKTFLVGNWCKDVDNYLDDNININTFNFYNWNNHKKKTQDVKLISKLYKKLVKKLSLNLNKIHNQNNSEKYWNFLLSRWLLTFISQVYAKWVITNYILRNHKIEKFFFIDFNDKVFIPENTKEAHYIASDLSGNYSNFCFREILNYRLKNLNAIKLPLKKIKEIPKKIIRNKFTLQKHRIMYFSFFKKIFFYNLSFDKKIIFFLQIKNFIFNLFIGSKKIVLEGSKEKDKREKFFSLMKESSGFEGFLIKHMRTLMPKEFLENYLAIYNEHLSLNWPRNPDYIATSYGQFYDELFKIYCARNISDKTKLYIFQHGYGTFFVDNDFYNTAWDKINCNRYLVWGNPFVKGYQPFFYTKKWLLKKNKKFKHKNNYKIISLIYGFSEQPKMSPHGYKDMYLRNKTISNKVIKFYYVLKKELKQKIDLRSLDTSYKKKVEKTIKSNFKNIVIHNPYMKPFYKHIDKFDITIHFFLGTTFFETIFLNKPSLLVFNEDHQFKIDKKFMRLINKLRKHSVVFDSAENAAIFLNNNINNLEKWWNNPAIEKIKEEFRNKYCRNFNMFSKDNKIFYEK